MLSAHRADTEQQAPEGAGLSVDASALRGGADNVVRLYARVTRDEQVALLSWRADALRALVARAIAEVGAHPRVMTTEDLTHTARARVAHVLDERLRGCTASILLAEHGIPPAISMAVIDSAERRRLRHMHLTRIEPRLFEESFLADPARIARTNQRVARLLDGAASIEVTSPAGTDLRVGLHSDYPVLQSDGRPDRGRPENLPAGTVQLHPARVDGVFIADRGAIGAVRPDPSLLRSAPLRVTFEGGRAVHAHSESKEVTALAWSYLRMHADAARVGIVALPTNHAVTAETGIEVQDALLPGLNVMLGYSNATYTRALYHCPVQLRLFGATLDVKVDDAFVVRGGRLRDDLVHDT